MSVRLAIIGGTGVYDPRVLDQIREETVLTPFGDVVARIGTYAGQEVAFLPRHGVNHSVPPHLINYRANLMAMKRLGVERIIATTAVGSLNKAMKPGDFVITDQFIDWTRGRVSTFFEGGVAGVVHTDFTVPYCPEIRRVLCSSARNLGITAHDGGTYVCTEGPRFETPAEIRMFAQLGGDLVGMTNVPEVVLAREIGICYATVSMVTNFGAGISETPLTHQEVLDVMAANGENLKRLIMSALTEIPSARGCTCGNQPGAMKV